MILKSKVRRREILAQFIQCSWCEPVVLSTCFVVNIITLEFQRLKHMSVYTPDIRNNVSALMKYCVHLRSPKKLAATEHLLSEIANNISNINI